MKNEKYDLPIFNEEFDDVYVERDQGLMQWEHDRIIVHRTTFKRIRAIGNKIFQDQKEKGKKRYADPAADMWMLYCFYFNKARQDKTNQPWALDTYCMKGLNWGKNKFCKIKKLLLENDFIEQIVRRTDDKSKNKRFYIKVNSMNKTNKFLSPRDGGSSAAEGVASRYTNALTREVKCFKDISKNVREEIQTFFEFFKIPEIDCKQWLKFYKNRIGYLLKQLRYVEKKEGIEDYTSYIQQALIKDFASTDSEAIAEREREWQDQKEGENIDAEAFSKEFGIGSVVPALDELSGDRVKSLKGLLNNCDDEKISAKIRKLIDSIEDGMSVEGQEPAIDELMLYFKQGHHRYSQAG